MDTTPAIIWDWNGTLLDDVDYAITCMNLLLERRGMPRLDRDRYRRIFGFPVERYYRRLGFDFRREPFAELSREFIDHYYQGLETPAPYPGARELVMELQGAGATQCVLSAMEIDPLRRQLATNGFLDAMELVQGLDHSHATSKVGEGEILLGKLNRPQESVLFIGDTAHDVEVAEALGLQAVILAHGHQLIRGKTCGPYPVAGDFGDLRHFLSSLYGLCLKLQD